MCGVRARERGGERKTASELEGEREVNRPRKLERAGESRRYEEREGYRKREEHVSAQGRDVQLPVLRQGMVGCGVRY